MSYNVQEKPKVSIGMPVYNAIPFIRDALDSLLNQTFQDFELIISDNASFDGTEEICRQYARLDTRIRYHRHDTNRGAAKNYNDLVEMASGEYFKWAAGDDICKPEFLSRCVNLLDQKPDCVVAYSKTTFVNEHDEQLTLQDRGWNLQMDETWKRLRYVILSGHFCNVIFGLMRIATLKETGLIGNYPGGDYRTIGELSARGKFYEIEEPLFIRRIHSGASSQNLNLDWQLVFYEPSTANRIVLPTWRRNSDHCRTILSSDMSIFRKISLLLVVARKLYWFRKRLFLEMSVAISKLSSHIRKK